ncbi:polymer-forming cytoskeletal protein [Thermoproteota archaeon]
MALGNKKNPKGQDHIIDVDASMQGSLVFKDPVNLRINGKFDGSLEVKGHLTIGETAMVNATIKGEHVSIAGKVKGDIDATSRVELSEQAVVEGNIKSPRLIMEDGAMFQGKCIMMQDVIGTDELAKHLELEEKTVLDWADTGKLPGFKEGNEWRFERKRIEDWIASGRIG